MSVVAERPLLTPENIGTDAESVFEPHPYMQGRPYTPNYAVLCSIIPHDLSHWMSHGGGRKHYFIPAAKKGTYNILKVYDTFTVIADLNARASNDDGAGDRMTQMPVPARPLAEDDLMRIFGGDSIGNKDGRRPGIMVIAGDTPKQRELDQLVEMHTNYCNGLVVEADDYHIRGFRANIIEQHREAAKWLGVEDREWYRRIEVTAKKKCPRCAEEINSMATLCKECKTDLIRFYKDQGIAVTEEIDPGVWSWNQRMKAAQPQKG